MYQKMEFFDLYLLCHQATRCLNPYLEVNVNDFFEPLSEGIEGENVFNKYSVLHECKLRRI